MIWIAVAALVVGVLHQDARIKQLEADVLWLKKDIAGYEA